MNKELDAYRAIATLEMSAMHDEKMTVEKAEKLRKVIEKELEALEIIKNKGVFVHLLQQSQNAKGYNSLMIVAFKKMAERDYKGVVEKFCLTQQEFDLLKEVLNYGK